MPTMPEQNRSDSPASLSHQAPFPPHPLTRGLAADLGETDQHAIAYINRIVWILGPAVAELLADEAYTLHAGAGMLTRDGSRQRTLGGIFFRLAYGRASRAQKRLLRPDLQVQQRPATRHRKRAGASTAPQVSPAGASQKAAGTPIPFVPFEQVARAAESWEAGTVSKAEIRLVGRPVKVQSDANGQYVAFTLPPMPLPALPGWLPRPPDRRFLVFVTTKQWQAVEPALQDPTVRVIVEGFGVLLPQFTGGIAVLATKCVSLLAAEAKSPEPVAAQPSNAHHE